jgi:hypothetical protein
MLDRLNRKLHMNVALVCLKLRKVSDLSGKCDEKRVLRTLKIRVRLLSKRLREDIDD